MDELESLYLHRVRDKKKLNIFDLVTAMEVTQSIEEATTLTVTVHDPDWDFLDNGWFDTDVDGRLDAIDVRLDKDDDLWFRLVKVAPSATTTVLTFEDRNVTYLRHKLKAQKVSRNKSTRAEFIKDLVDQVKTVDIGFYCPELHVKQPIATAKPTEDEKSDRDSDRQEGFRSGIKLKGKETTLSQQALDNAEIVLNEAARLKAGPKATKALVEACIIEAPDFANPTGGDDSSVGILQLLNSHLGGSSSTKGGRRDIALVCKMFLQDGFTDGVGAIEYAKANPSATAGQVAQHCQGSAHPDRYDGVSAQADDIIDAFGGATGDGSTTTTTVIAYEFQVEKGEDYWTAMRRLADEVNWRLFSAEGKVYFADDYSLLRSRPRALIDRKDRSRIFDMSFDWDVGSNYPHEMSVSALIEAFEFPPGTVCDVLGAGPANGRWLVTSITFDPLNLDSPAQITLNSPEVPKAEPAAERKTETTDSDGEASLGSGSLREKIIAEAEKTLTSKTGHNYYLAGGTTTDNPLAKAPLRSDCSQWVRAVYLKAGANDPGNDTTAQFAKGKTTTKPQPGDLVLDSNGTHHVELYVGDGKTIGHGSKPIDGWTTDGMRSYYGGVVFKTFDFLDS